MRSNRAIPTSKLKACREFRVIALSLCPTLCPTKVSVQLLFLAFLAVLGMGREALQLLFIRLVTARIHKKLILKT